MGGGNIFNALLVEESLQAVDFFTLGLGFVGNPSNAGHFG